MKILLVEDARAVSALMMARLSSFGHEVVLAENGKVAVELFRNSPPDLVLMDIEMPVMNGFEAANQIRAIEAMQLWAWTPIIFLTASDTVENLVTAIEAGGDDFMAKSTPEAVLQAKMRAMARIALLRQRLSVANRKLEELATQDGLTGLCNRRSMDLRVDAAWELAVRQGKSFGLLMLDIDHFKKYNDRYGHQLGDDCLKVFANTVAAIVDAANARGATQEAFAARYGGEEFSVIIPGASRRDYLDVASAIVHDIRQLAIPHQDNAEWGVVTVSVGGQFLETASGNIVELFRTADQRLYQSKERGRNCAVVD